MVKFFDYVTSGVRELKSTDFIKKINGEIRCVHPDIKGKNGMVMFYAPWCNQSRALRQAWSDMAQAGGQRFPYMAVNCDNERGIANALKIQGYPSFKFVRIDGTLGHYNGSRTVEGFNTFMCHSIGIETGQNNNIQASNFHYSTGAFSNKSAFPQQSSLMPSSQEQFQNSQQAQKNRPAQQYNQHRPPQDNNEHTPYISLENPRTSWRFAQSRQTAFDPRKDKYNPSSYKLSSQGHANQVPNAPEEKYITNNPLKKIKIPRPQFW